jgi:hypothetical protein
MSSWSLLLALSGWQYDGPRRALRLGPRHSPAEFRCPFTGPEGWGSVAQKRDAQGQTNELSVREGRLALAEITLDAPAAPKSAEVWVAGQVIETSLAVAEGRAVLSLKQPLIVGAGQTLGIRLAG